MNRYIRWLNPQQSFFITTQFFHRHVFDSPRDLVLPVPQRVIEVNSNAPLVGTEPPLGFGCGVGGGKKRPCPLRPRFFHLDDDRFLNTLLISTSYHGGRVVPQVGMFYDWQGTIVFQPGVTLIRDPFRFVVDYTGLYGPPTGSFGTLRDRDNVRAQVEYVF